MAAIPPLFTVHDNMVICGINDATLFQGRTQAERIAYEIFSDDFNTTMDVSIDELNDELKTLAGMTTAQGQIRLMPGIKKNIRAFIQWCRDEFRMGRDPATVHFLEMYIQMAPLHGEAFTMDNAKVLVLLRKFIVGNTQAEATLRAINVEGKGRDAFIALRTHYEGEGLLAQDIVEAENTIKNLYYVGEKPTMNWTMFERMLKKAYAASDKHEGRVVHSKVTASFLQLNKTAIDTEIGKRPMVMNFTTALRIYRTAVREKFPQGANNATDRGRHLGEARASNDRNRRNDDRSRSRNGGGRNRHRDEEEITLSNGEKIWYHPSYHFPRDQLRAMTDPQRERMSNERAAHRARQGMPARQTRQSNTETQLSELRAEIASLRSNNVPGAVETGESATRISQVTMGTGGTSVMGGRNQQASGRNQQAGGSSP
ncbi:unnamed protein product [Cylindrotheca closterium]|uniref:Uncharacterized protein n=1 Tax=Cylindrotheca closterium TaxID=2856 RepID=A0AAD2G704_9STRA|nr:unnamed protein product [Cylindrotheca closterium]